MPKHCGSQIDQIALTLSLQFCVGEALVVRHQRRNHPKIHEHIGLIKQRIQTLKKISLTFDSLEPYQLNTNKYGKAKNYSMNVIADQFFELNPLNLHINAPMPALSLH